ncbi:MULTISPECIES: terminase large subunit domain-containing protein [unclassified Vibrio]|uniref:terminase large subunit domain-containing protein n=1 Tax=unclassified Vibrio TaxID=2614977 RepID=UPI001361E22B|nr:MULTISPECIES: terminase family protein [unclassified Vibrio]NAW58486.1 terminase [Vibrio sp. V36_P2S2PM302]NAX24958.1 terminase [Vibrio sp. V38_P2S17PM301]NAX32558.1 terminase [Vibrio sp. V37_P2S8PM304]
MKNSKYSDEQRDKAKKLYLAGMNPKEIANEVGVNGSRTIYNWAKRFHWDDELSEFGTERLLELRLQQLTQRENKTRLELDEIDRLIKNVVTLRRSNCELEERKQAIRQADAQLQYMENVGECPQTGSRASHGDKSGNRRKKKVKNDVSHLTEASFQTWIGSLFKYQKIQFNNRHQKERWTLKSRQIGLTYEAAGEALFKAVINGRNQTFLSASRAQAEVFRSYIIHIAKEFLGIELQGNPIKLPNDAELRFLGTNKNTAQSYSSDVYIDEAFWINKFDKIYEVASAMATLAHHTITVFSTPSTKQHSAYPLWSGSWWKGQDKDRIDIEFPTLERLRKTPQVCADKRWRFAITIDDAIAGGNTLINRADLEERYSKEAFAYLFLCQFMDEADSIFKLKDIELCSVDIDDWTDYDRELVRPFGDKEVWIGYDPSRYNDFARCFVVAPPDAYNVVAQLDKFKDKFRVLEGYEWKGFNWQWQADQIESLTQRFNVQHIGIDISGIGSGVGELVQAFFPRAMLINYSLQTKTELVLKMLDVVQHRRILWPSTEKTIGVSFMAIKRKATGKGQMTFVAERTEETGHADDFFALSHALIKEGLNVSRKRQSTYRIGL